jgi:hypothetical protein
MSKAVIYKGISLATVTRGWQAGAIRKPRPPLADRDQGWTARAFPNRDRRRRTDGGFRTTSHSDTETTPSSQTVAALGKLCPVL